jgi:hypothetical protein
MSRISDLRIGAGKANLRAAFGLSVIAVSVFA